MYIPLLHGLLLTIAVETPVLIVGLSSQHKLSRKIWAGIWLSTCTYPIVNLIIPLLIDPVTSRIQYVVTAETFAPVAECFLFWLVYDRRGSDKTSIFRNFATIVIANLLSFGTGEVLKLIGEL